MTTFRVTGRVWLETENDRFMGIGRVELLKYIDQTGSINQAAKAMKMSYKRAWELVNSMNQQASEPLVVTQTGGEKGGGTVLTDEGRRQIARFEALQDRFQQFLATETARLTT